jgi:hypothetical protein
MFSLGMQNLQYELHSKKRQHTQMRLTAAPRSAFRRTPVLFDDRIDTVRDECSSIVRCFLPLITEELASFRWHSPQRAAVFLEFHQFQADWNAACL